MGYWLPHTSSVDFCESNYLHFYHVVELHNVWSSLFGITAFGLLGLASGNPTKEWRHAIAYATLAIIGVGSAGLHGCLHWVFQSSDELPMIYLVLCLVYMCAEVDAPRGKPNHPWAAPVAFVVAAINTVVYYAFRHLYWVFLLTFGTLSTTVFLWSYHLSFRVPGRGADPKLIALLGAGFYLFGFMLWIFDMLHCDNYVAPVADTLPGPLKGLTPHVVWHITAGLGGYCGAVNLCCCRLEALQMEYAVAYVLGVVPVIKAKRNWDGAASARKVK